LKCETCTTRGDGDKNRASSDSEYKSLQFRRRLRDFLAPVWGLPLVDVYVPVRDKIRSEGFAVAANISRRSGGAFNRAAAVGGVEVQWFASWSLFVCIVAASFFVLLRHTSVLHPGP
jgi:hypothetical protein